MDTIRIVIIISMLCGIRIESTMPIPIQMYNKIAIFDDSHYYPNDGVYLEPSGQYISYAGSITIPFVYMLPNIQVIHNSGCPGYKQVLSLYLNILEHIKSITDINKNSNNTHNINKRSLLPIVSVLSGGLSVWNTIEIQGIQHKISHMKSNMVHIDKSLQNIIDSENKIIHRVGEISIIVSDHSKIINKLYNITTCLHQDTKEFIDIVSKWLYNAPIEFINAYSGAVTGKITPSLLSSINLHKIILTHNEMEETLYQQEPSIVYELGQVLITDVQVNEIAYIKGLIQLPKILSIAPLPMYNVYTVNILRNNIDYVYELPSILVCPNLSNCWKPDYEKCTKKSNRLLCMYGANTYPNKCINNLFLNITVDCTLKVRIHKSPIAIQTGSGVLLGGSKRDHKIFKRMGQLDVPHNIIKSRDESILITPQMGDWLTINDNIFNTKISGFSYNYTIYITSNNNSHNINPIKLKDEWKNINDIKYEPLKLDSLDTVNGVCLILIISVLALSIIISYIYIKLRYLLKTQVKHRITTNSDFLGLR